MIINIDASHSQQTKTGRIAVIIKDNKNVVLNQITDHISCNTAAYSEIKAMIEVIYYIDKMMKKENVSVFTDCEIVCSLFNKGHFEQKLNKIIRRKTYLATDIKVNKDEMLNIREKLKKIRLKNKVLIQWTPRENNREADRLSKMYIVKHNRKQRKRNRKNKILEVK